MRDSVTKLDLIELMVEKENNRQKWQLVSLAMFGDPDDPRFAFIAHYPNLRPWTIEFDVVSQLDHIGKAIPKAAQRYFPTIVTGTGASELARPDYFRLTVVYEKFPPDINPAAVLTIYESWDEMAAGVGDQNSMIVSLDSFGTVKNSGGKKVYLERLVNIRYNQTQQFWLPWSVQKLDDVPKNDAAGVQHSPKNGAVMKNWARIDHAVPSRWRFAGDDATFVHYRKDMYEAWPASLQDEFVQGKRVVGPVVPVHRVDGMSDGGSRRRRCA
ncbi:MAG: hypothetical protein JNL21_07255 [Myxococcales bacterium]|nr:hypothetical protein [Myxococcales bacterium]